MFFSSRGSLLVAGILLLAGCACFFLSREDADSARREKTTVGVIDSVGGGSRGTSYYFEFEIDGVKLYNESGSCRTALSPKGCKVGASVLVYYDHNPTLRSKLREFGAVSRDDFFTGAWMVFGGFLLVVLHFVSRRILESPDDSDDTGVNRPDEGSDIFHVVPDK